MKVHIIGSSSKGNGYVIEYENRYVVIEAGVPFKEVQKVVQFKTKHIVCGLVSHSHGDHAKYLKDYLRRGLVFYGPREVCDSSHRYVPLVYSQDNVSTFKATAEPYSFKGIRVAHDVPCMAFVIDVGEHRMLYVSDTHSFPYAVPGVTDLLIEANYCPTIIDRRIGEGSLDPALAQRIKNSHMSIEDTLDIIRRHLYTRSVTLLHLSDGNAHAEAFKEKCEQALGVPTSIANKNQCIEL